MRERAELARGDVYEAEVMKAWIFVLIIGIAISVTFPPTGAQARTLDDAGQKPKQGGGSISSALGATDVSFSMKSTRNSRLLVVVGVSFMLAQSTATRGVQTGPPAAISSREGAACRTYATEQTASTTTTAKPTGAVITSTAKRTCTFNKPTNEFSCKFEYADSRPESWSGVMTVRYASVGEFVGDAPRIYLYSTGATRPAVMTNRITTSGMVTDVTSTHTYDDAGRLTRVDHLTNSGYKSAETFSSWDAFGRPTAGRSATGETVTFAYNDAELTLTHSFATGSATVRYDPNGLRIGQTLDSSTTMSRENITVRATATVCR